MAEVGILLAVIVATFSAIIAAMQYGTRHINDLARDSSIRRDRPMVLPPPKETSAPAASV
jgi:hypothetical protein